MKISERLEIALGALAGRDVIGEKVAKIDKEFKAAQVIRYGDAEAPEIKFENLVKYGWRRNELIYTCVSKKANTASQVKLQVMSGENPVENHPLRKLLEHPNEYMNEFDFWSSVIILQDFAGNAYFEKIRSLAGQTVELWPMRPDWVKVSYDRDGRIDGYFYCIPDKAPIPYRPEDILPFKLYDPLNAYFGYPPVAVAARVGDLDNSTTDYVRLLFQEGGVPPGILSSKQPINEATARRLREMYREQYGGYQNWDAPMVLGYDTAYTQTGLGIQEMGLEILDRRAEVRICMTLKVPPMLIGSRIGLERSIESNVKEFQKNWWDDDLMPIYKNYSDVVRQHLLPEYGESNVELEWDFSEVPALQEDEDALRMQALEAFKAGAITRNQFNEAWGLDPLGNVGDVYLLTGFMMEVPAGQAVAPDAQDVNQPDITEEDTEEAADGREVSHKYTNLNSEYLAMLKAQKSPACRQSDETESECVARKIPEILDENPDMAQDQAVAIAHSMCSEECSSKSTKQVPEDDVREKHERLIEFVMNEFLAGELKRIEDHINEFIQSRVQKQLPIDDMFWNNERERLFDVLFPIIAGATVDAAKIAFSSLADVVEIGVAWDSVHEQAIQWAIKNTRSVVAQITQTSMDGFLAEFEPWMRSGKPLKELIKELEKYYGPMRARWVGVTETTRAFTQGNVAFWNSTGMVDGYNFRTSEDDKVCPLCDGVTGSQSRNPHRMDDYDDMPPRHVNCRCGISPITVKINASSPA